MNKRHLSYRIYFALVIGLSLSACRISFLEADKAQAAQEGEAIGMANPAAQYCEGLGYRTESIERDGGMDADCVFPNGERCGQWDFLAGRCGQEMSYCELRAGGAIQESGNLGVCVFSDGSTCNELELFYGDCIMGDNPAIVEQAALTEDAQVEESEEEEIRVTNFTAARDQLMTYLSEAYGEEAPGPWMEADITSPDAAGVNSFRYVSGPLTVILSAEAAAPYASIYTVQEATNRSNGFWWTGAIDVNGKIVENEVVLPWSILSPEEARESVCGFLSVHYDISLPSIWLDEGNSQTGDSKISRRFSAGSWLVKVEFEPAAPLVSSYYVAVENSSSGMSWEGDISGHGEIVQVSFSQ